MGTLTQVGLILSIFCYDLLIYFFFHFFFFFFRKEMKMNLTIVISILCFISAAAGIPAPGSSGAKDVDERKKANRQTDCDSDSDADERSGKAVAEGGLDSDSDSDSDSESRSTTPKNLVLPGGGCLDRDDGLTYKRFEIKKIKPCEYRGCDTGLIWVFPIYCSSIGRDCKNPFEIPGNCCRVCDLKEAGREKQQIPIVGKIGSRA